MKVVVLPPEYIGIQQAFSTMASDTPSPGEMPPRHTKPLGSAALQLWRKSGRAPTETRDFSKWQKTYRDRLQKAAKVLEDGLKQGELIAYAIDGESAAALQESGLLPPEYWQRALPETWGSPFVDGRILDTKSMHLRDAPVALRRDEFEVWKAANSPRYANQVRPKIKHAASKQEYLNHISAMLELVKRRGWRTTQLQGLKYCRSRLGSRFRRDPFLEAWKAHPQTFQHTVQGARGKNMADLETLLEG